MKANDYVKYMTQQLVKQMAVPKEDRMQHRMQRKLEKQPFSSKWFGVIPLAIKMLFQKK
ncbi:YqzE family protein [Peribacillus saganii]|uniref:YqzE family protein n=1 Tax=Peribacillus saganii TaxID=2303992 RepID=A0A372LK14_9BACI|nr:YqzE family protein [Peribacillus saganii]RFU66775.1 YqzE family protein [Peribacillus saganii]